MSLVAAVRDKIPKRAKRAVRLVVSEAPVRVRDALPDLLQILGVLRRSDPLPPRALRGRTGRTSSRKEFVFVGRTVARDLRTAFESVRDPAGEYGRWLDFGCGSGRVARFVCDFPVVRTLCGVDVDDEAIRWNRSHLRKGAFFPLTDGSAIPFAVASFDVVFAVSVFSHFDESSQQKWLREVHRVLRPGGLFLASTHSERLRYSRPDLTIEQHRELNARGFLFAPGGGTFQSDSSFHTRRYLEEEWGKLFRIRLHCEHGLARFQDLSVWEKSRPHSPAGPAPAT
ncbi:MAG TPA: class I SAM-dependent methyltransferase [Thermoanaerobaculia bacterium]|nr:class I SAM-dependent methyltransferase [Thermoanaerobaculia bacterium]